MVSSDKRTYYEETEIKLKILKTRIMTLERRSEKAEADIEVRFDQKMKQIRGQYAQTKDKLDELQAFDHDDWFDLKTGVDQALTALSEAVDAVERLISVQHEK